MPDLMAVVQRGEMPSMRLEGMRALPTVSALFHHLGIDEKATRPAILELKRAGREQQRAKTRAGLAERPEVGRRRASRYVETGTAARSGAHASRSPTGTRGSSGCEQERRPKYEAWKPEQKAEKRAKLGLRRSCWFV